MLKIPAKCFLFYLLFFGAYSASGQRLKYSAANAHSHNDYLNKNPFSLAFSKEFGSIEADIFLRNNVLLVAHSKKELSPENTLSRLYLDPVLAELKKNPSRKLNLLIDVKEDYKNVLPALVSELIKLQPFCSTVDSQRNVTILISGTRPAPAEYANYPDYIFFDDDLVLPHTPEQWKRVGLVSLNFTKYSKWDGITNVSKSDKDSIKSVISKVHKMNKPIRFWAAPDTNKSWQLQMKLKANYIGTDQIIGLADFLNKHK